MKEGAWLNRQGAWAWITEHASWIQTPKNARGLGMPEAAILRLAQILRDFNGVGRRAILMEAMAQGFIRVRGHGVDCTFEHTMPQNEAVQAAGPFMALHFGPLTWVRFTNVQTRETIEAPYCELLKTFRLEGEPGGPPLLTPRRSTMTTKANDALPEEPEGTSTTETTTVEVATPFLFCTEEEVLANILLNHPGLTREEAEEMARCLGW